MYRPVVDDYALFRSLNLVLYDLVLKSVDIVLTDDSCQSLGRLIHQLLKSIQGFLASFQVFVKIATELLHDVHDFYDSHLQFLRNFVVFTIL